MNGIQRAIFCEVRAEFLSCNIRLLPNQFNKFKAFSLGKNRNPMPAWARLKPLLPFKFTNPPAHAVQVVAQDVSDLLP